MNKEKLLELHYDFSKSLLLFSFGSLITVSLYINSLRNDASAETISALRIMLKGFGLMAVILIPCLGYNFYKLNGYYEGNRK